MPSRTLELEFPAGGLDRRLAFQKQKPFTSPHVLNVRPADPLDQRRRGGSRPDLVKAYAQQLGSGAPIVMLNSVRTAEAGGSVQFNDLFDDNPMSATNWAAPTTAADGLFDTSAASGFGRTLVGETRGAKLLATTTDLIEKTATVSLALKITGPNGVGVVFDHPTDTKEIVYELYAYATDAGEGLADYIRGRLRAYVDSATNLAKVDLEIHTSASGEVASVNIYSNLRGGSPMTLPGWLGLEVGGTGQTTVRWLSSDLNKSVTFDNGTDFDALTGQRCAVQVANDVLSQVAIADISHFVLGYTSTAAIGPPEQVIAVSGGQLYREAPQGTMVILTANTDTVTTDGVDFEPTPIQSTGRLGKMYIADFAEVPRRELKASSANVTVTAAGVMTDAETSTSLNNVPNGASLFVTAGDTKVIAKGDVLEVIAVTGGDIAVGWYQVTVVTDDTTLTFKNFDGTDPGTVAATDLQYRIVPGLKVHDTATAKTTLWVADTGKGVLPYGCQSISQHLDRMVLGGDPRLPGVAFMSRQGDPQDWLEDATDDQSAVFLNSTDGLVETVGAPITGFIRYTRDYFIICTDRDMWLIRGDLRQGGSLAGLSGNIGILGPFAFNVDSNNNLIIVARSGAYRFTEKHIAAEAEPQPFSKEIIPKELRNINPSLYNVLLEANPDEPGVYLWSTPLSGGEAAEFWVDTQTERFFRDTLTPDHQVFSAHHLNRDNAMLVGCRDGYIRTYSLDSTTGNDDGTVRTAEVDYGPIPLNRGLGATADSIKITLDRQSGLVAWTFRTGETPEEAFDAAPVATGSASAGQNYRQPVRMSGQWGFLRLTTILAVRWAVEGIKLRVLPAGEQRKI